MKKSWPVSPLFSSRSLCRLDETSVAGQPYSRYAVFDLDRHQARIDGQAGKPLVYVDFVENAPWNRPELNNPPRFRGVGSVLIRATIALSHHYEYKGRIDLHSLPHAHDFCANDCGMTDLGQDEHYDRLRYFEMTPEQADAFITKGGKS